MDLLSQNFDTMDKAIEGFIMYRIMVGGLITRGGGV